MEDRTPVTPSESVPGVGPRGCSPNTLGVDQTTLGVFPEHPGRRSNDPGGVPRTPWASIKRPWGCSPNTLGVDQTTLGCSPNTLGVDQTTLGCSPNTLGVDQTTLGCSPNTLGVDQTTPGVFPQHPGGRSNDPGGVPRTPWASIKRPRGCSPNTLGVDRTTQGVFHEHPGGRSIDPGGVPRTPWGSIERPRGCSPNTLGVVRSTQGVFLEHAKSNVLRTVTGIAWHGSGRSLPIQAQGRTVRLPRKRSGPRQAEPTDRPRRPQVYSRQSTTGSARRVRPDASGSNDAPVRSMRRGERAQVWVVS